MSSPSAARRDPFISCSVFVKRQSKTMGPRKHFLPLILLLSLSALFIFSHYHSYLPLSSPSHANPNFPLNEKLPGPKTSNFTFIIKVLAFNRLDSLSRCLRSLAGADYQSDLVHLHVYIDHLGNDDGRLKLNDSHRMLEFVDSFVWNFGEKLVHYRTGNVGLQAQWLEAWWPSSDDEFAFVVEDDLEVSPLYYRFLRSMISNYYYNKTNFSPSIYGASLQRPRFVPGKHGNKLQLDSGTRVFSYQLVGTWGQLLFPKPWKEFRLWYDEQKAMGNKPFLDGMVTTGWYKKKGERIWTPWFIKFIHSRSYFNIYTHFSGERALSVSHRDAGVNYGKTAGPDSELLDGSSVESDFLDMPPLSDLKWYDFCFREVHRERVITNSDELWSTLQAVQKHKTIIFVSLFGVSESVARNLLCHFERLNMENYIIFGPGSEFLLDLARRGHTVIFSEQFLRTVRDHKFTAFDDSSGWRIKELLTKVYIIQKCLDDGYNSWLVDGNMLFTKGDPFPLSSSANDFYVAKTMELLFVGSSSSVRRIWGTYVVPKLEAVVRSSTGRGSSLTESLSLRQLAMKLTQQNSVTIGTVDEMSLGVNVGGDILPNSTLGDGKELVFWPAGLSEGVIQRRLDELGLWLLDADNSCKAVFCH